MAQPCEALVVAAVRTPVARGKRNGALHEVHPVDLSAHVIRAAVERSGIDPSIIDDVVWGCALPEAAQGLNIARFALLRAGLPVDVPGVTVNRFCSSGLQAIAIAAQSIIAGMADVVLAGGIEMMSQVPIGGFHTRLHPELTDSYIGMGNTAERVAARWGVGRDEQDSWALRSHERAAAAEDAGRFLSETVSVSVERETGEARTFASEELVRRDTSREQLAGLEPAFKEGGTVTAGNTAPFSDGAAALLVASREAAEREGLRPLARFIGYSIAGVEPALMGIGPAKAVPKVLARVGLSIDDVDLIELNEAFAAQTLAVLRELDLDEEKVNTNGGAIALGHPLGATGAKLTAQAVHELRRRGGGVALITMCVGGGMGAAGLFEVYGNGGTELVENKEVDGQ